ncbi:MAG: hypothetical protein ACR2OJ_09860 [Hyphomicrobiales bacterium]
MLAPAAFACGTAMMMPLLFKAYPEARTVFDATLDARKNKIIVGANWPGIDVMSLHQWRTRKMAMTLMALKRKLDRVPEAGRTRSSAHILFVNEMAWSEIAIGISGVAITQGGFPSDARAYVFTTRRAMDTLLTGKISYDDAVRLKLVQFKLKEGGNSGALDLFKQALSGEARSVKHTMHMPIAPVD